MISSSISLSDSAILPTGDAEMAFCELRQYKVLPGKMDEWVKIMEEEIIPFQVSKGMVICGSFRGETDDSAYVWLRRFESEAEREALYKAVCTKPLRGSSVN